jgi:A/G-specific adenine glycosylase
MLQQTQVATVLPYYRRWLKRFPTFAALAAASEREVLHAWQGLGYYARARNLHKTAKIVMRRYRGQFPRSIDEMRSLPGIGNYTAHAVATFAFNQPVPIVETNTARVLTRLFNLRSPIDSAAGRQTLWKHAGALVPNKSAARFNSALIDLGAIVCLPRQPKCALCPVKKFCRAKNPESLPRRRPRPRPKSLLEQHSFVKRGGKLLLAKANRRWRGMWILPSFRFDRSKESSLRAAPIHITVFPFTHHRITLQIFRDQPFKIDRQQTRWFSRRELESIPVPSPHRRAINTLLDKRRTSRAGQGEAVA